MPPFPPSIRPCPVYHLPPSMQITQDFGYTPRPAVQSSLPTSPLKLRSTSISYHMRCIQAHAPFFFLIARDSYRTLPPLFLPRDRGVNCRLPSIPLLLPTSLSPVRLVFQPPRPAHLDKGASTHSFPPARHLELLLIQAPTFPSNSLLSIVLSTQAFGLFSPKLPPSVYAFLYNLRVPPSSLFFPFNPVFALFAFLEEGPRGLPFYAQCSPVLPPLQV